MTESEGQFLRLETVGRKTGKAHTVLLRFVTYDGKIIVFHAKNSTQDWLFNLMSNPKVRVHFGGRVMQGTATTAKTRGPNDPVLSVFTRKYSERVVRGTYWGQTEYVQISLGEQLTTESFSELVYADLEAAFDGVAEDYDRHIFGNAINVWLRNRSIALMSKLFRPGQTILEVGCGTGTETLSLAKQGIRVIATDISSRMLEVLSRKASDAGLGDMVVPIHARPYSLVHELAEKGFTEVDGAYSTYGAVNTDPRLTDFFANLHHLIKDDGKLILGVWNKYCAFEMVGYLLKANPAMAAARLKNPVPVGKSRFCVATNAFSVGELSALVGRYFRLRTAYGVGMFLPPSNLTKYLPPSSLTRLAKWADVSLEGSFPWNRLGDHFLGVYDKVS